MNDDVWSVLLTREDVQTLRRAAGPALLLVVAIAVAGVVMYGMYWVLRPVDWGVFGIVLCGALFVCEMLRGGFSLRRAVLRGQGEATTLALNVALVTVMAALLTSALLQERVGGVVTVKDGTPVSALSSEARSDTAWEYLLFSGADAIPTLKVPETFGWEPANRPDGFWPGLVLLIYKLVIVLPLLALIVAAISLSPPVASRSRARTKPPRADPLPVAGPPPPPATG